MSKTQSKKNNSIHSKRNDPYYQAQDILSRRDHSEYEVRQKMRHKGFSASVINEVIVWLNKQKYLSDSLFAQRYCEGILLAKPVGPRLLKQKLTQKRVAPAIIDQVIASTYEQTSETDLARRAAQNWRRSHPLKSDRHPDQQKYQQRLIRHLASRGFSYDVISDVV